MADLHLWGQDADTVVGEELRGAPDPAVWQAASDAGRVLLTLDKGIANLQRYPIHQHAGVVLFRPDKLGALSLPSCASVSKELLKRT